MVARLEYVVIDDGGGVWGRYGDYREASALVDGTSTPLRILIRRPGRSAL